MLLNSYSKNNMLLNPFRDRELITWGCFLNHLQHLLGKIQGHLITFEEILATFWHDKNSKCDFRYFLMWIVSKKAVYRCCMNEFISLLFNYGEILE